MAKKNKDALATERSVRNQLATKSRDRRKHLARLAQPEAPRRRPRNDLLPGLALVGIDPDNLRTMARKVREADPAHVRAVAGSISALGFCNPILVGKDNMVLDGEIRVAAAKLLGLTTVPCIRVEHLAEADQRTLRLAVNRLGEKGSWDINELKIEFDELILLDAPIEIAGFTLDEIDHIRLAEDLAAVEPGPLDPLSGAAPCAKLGDIYSLGEHRIICGDATDPATMARLMADGAVSRFILTDEPYNVPIAGHVTGGSHRKFAMASGEMSNEQFLTFNVTWIDAALPYLCQGGVFGTFIDWRGNPIVHAAAIKLGLTPLNLIVWAKTNAGMGSLYRSQHELLPLFKNGNAPHINNIELGKRGRWRSNVWTYPGASSLGSDAREGLVDHPTVKPTAMLQDVLLDLTNRGDLVLDPFLGSGSTLIAAEHTGRTCRGIELDPLYVDLIIRRYELLTGRAAILEDPGETRAEPYEALPA